VGPSPQLRKRRAFAAATSSVRGTWRPSAISARSLLSSATMRASRAAVSRPASSSPARARRRGQSVRLHMLRSVRWLWSHVCITFCKSPGPAKHRRRPPLRQATKGAALPCGTSMFQLPSAAKSARPRHMPANRPFSAVRARLRNYSRPDAPRRGSRATRLIPSPLSRAFFAQKIIA
jgi:hypothetical protein